MRHLPPPARWLCILLIGSLGLVSSTGCTTGINPVTGNTRAYGYTWQQELQMGQQADQQIVSQYGVYDDDELQAYVDRVARDVLAVSHMRRESTAQKFRTTEFTFRILDSEVINAFALPGGYVYVTRGLLAHLNNEAQLAVVLGHEIGHVAARHSSEQAARQQLMQIGLVGTAILGQQVLGGQAAQQILGLGGQAAQLLSLSYSRENEREADQLGVEYAAMAGYKASEGAEFFESLKRIQQQSAQAIPTWQSTHPDPGAREDKIVQLANTWQQRLQTPMTTVDQDQYYNNLERTVVGKNPRQGFVRDGTFYHPEMAFRFPVPSNYQVINQAAQVAMVAPSQEAYLLFGGYNTPTTAAAADSFAAQQGVTVVRRDRDPYGAFDPQQVLLEGQTQQGQMLRLLGYFLEYNDTVFGFKGITAAATYDTYQPVFLETMRGFDRLTDQRILSIQPYRLAIRPAGRSAPFRTFVSDLSLPEGMTEDDVAIINQIQLETVVAPSQPLKLPQR
ncbi:M48 family metalloprotease [Salisaeta longa]|uniref:M48 family metalloprotease n=1 Tax=Salisaeta longa TaxID=503170 RepID=UPI0003B6A99D|nr:M48 family metallopeptidase [Salisaeta longa]